MLPYDIQDNFLFFFSVIGLCKSYTNLMWILELQYFGPLGFFFRTVLQGNRSWEELIKPELCTGHMLAGSNW